MEEKKFNLFSLYHTNKKYLFIVLKTIYLPILGALAVSYFFYKAENKKATIYSSAIVYMLDEDLGGGGGGGGASSNPMLAAFMGGGGNSNKTLLVDLAQSNKMIETTLLKTVSIDSKYVVLANYFMKKNGYFDGKSKAEIKSMLFPENYTIGKNSEKDYLIRSLSKTVKESFVSKTLESGLLTLEYSNNNEAFVKALLDNHFLTISEFYAIRKSQRSAELIQKTKKKKDSLLGAVRSRESGLASSRDNDFGVVMNRAKVDEMAQQRELTIAQAQYTESVAAYNSALIDMEKNKPIISIIDDPRLPLNSIGPEPMPIAIKMFFVFFVIEIVIAFLVLFVIDFLKQQKAEYATIQQPK